jgi:hypothetical protein
MWRAAQAEAAEAERAYFEAALAYTRGFGPQPDDETVSKAKRHRARCQSLFQLAMSQLDAREVSLPRYRPDGEAGFRGRPKTGLTRFGDLPEF